MGEGGNSVQSALVSDMARNEYEGGGGVMQYKEVWLVTWQGMISYVWDVYNLLMS